MDDLDPTRQVFKEMIRPYKAALTVAIPIFLAVAGYGYQVVMFMNQDTIHETAQDSAIAELRIELREAREDHIRLRALYLDLLRLTITDLDLLRELQLRSMPRKAREEVRRDFDTQRDNALNLLVKAQKSP